jgi:hypothetical protein
VDYAAVNAIGTVLRTFGDVATAKAWARENAAQWPGVQIDEITITTLRRRVYRPVAYLREVAS